KFIIATLKPYKLDEVREALIAVGVRGMMVTEVKGFGTQSGHTEIYRGAEYAVNFVPKVKLELAVPDALAETAVETVAKAARTGKIGDGKIFVLDLESVLRVRTGETGEDALRQPHHQERNNEHESQNVHRAPRSAAVCRARHRPGRRPCH